MPAMSDQPSTPDDAPSGLPPDEPEEAPLGVPEARPEGEDEPERGPDAMPGIPTEGEPPRPAELDAAAPSDAVDSAVASGVVSIACSRCSSASLLPPAVFGVFALLAMWLGAETRPWFDERPVLDDRPNWWPDRPARAARSRRRADEADEPDDGTPAPGGAASGAGRALSRARRPSTSAATSPSGV